MLRLAAIAAAGWALHSPGFPLLQSLDQEERMPLGIARHQLFYEAQIVLRKLFGPPSRSERVRHRPPEPSKTGATTDESGVGSPSRLGTQVGPRGRQCANRLRQASPSSALSSWSGRLAYSHIAATWSTR
jgi:hypothetical protein